MARDHKLSFVIPRRKSSIAALRGDPPSHSRRGSVEDTGLHNNNNNTSAKAHKILGSSEADVRQQQHESMAKSRSKKVPGRSSLMRIAESRSGVVDQEQEKRDGRASRSDSVSNNNDNNGNLLRQRASSPLLGNNYRTRQGSLASLPPPAKPPVPPVQLPARSSSKLHSFYDVHQPSSHATSEKPTTKSQGDLSIRKGTRPTKRSDHNGSNQQEQQAAAEPVNEKRRPPRIDLSMLFPKPRPQAVPLLSPQRYTNSPSPVSMNSDVSPTKTQPPGNKLTKPQQRPRDSVRMMRQKQNDQTGNQMMSSARADRRGQPREWFDGPEGDVSDEETSYFKHNSISAVVPGSGHQQSRWGNGPHDIIQTHDGPSAITEIESIGIPSIGKGGRTPDSLATPTPASSITVKLQSSLQAWEFGSSQGSGSRGGSKTVSRKTSSSALHTSDLNESSILCLTSSDEEDEDEGPEDAGQRKSVGADSQMTDVEAAFRACTVGGIHSEAKASSSTKPRDIPTTRSPDPRPVERNFSRTRNTPMASGSRSRNAGKTRTRGTSGIPMISEPPEDVLPPLPSNPTLDTRSPEYLGRNRAPSSNRRSRVIAVTRQEESLLEIMRQKAGQQPQPSLFSDGTESTFSQEGRKAQYSRTHRSTNSVQSGGPFTDTSFLRLSTCSPSQTSPKHIVPDPGVSFMDSDGSVSYEASDTDQRTDNSNASPRISLIHSDTIPSPSTTSLASPLTPTLPMHKFSPQPAAAEPSPSSQSSGNMEQRQHSRTRTDSSTAIVLDGPDDASTKQRGRVNSTDLPVWAVGWRDDTPGLGVVH